MDAGYFYAMRHSTAALSVLAVCLLIQRSTCSVVAGIDPCDDASVCLSQQVITYNVTTQGQSSSAGFGSDAGAPVGAADGHGC